MALPAPDEPVLIIAGRGRLPVKLAKALGSQACVVGLKGFVDAMTARLATAQYCLGHFGAMMQTGRKCGARHVLFIGGLDRPAADQIDLDVFTRQHLNTRVLNQGDDAVLRAVVDLFAVGGFETIGPLDVAPELAMPLGALGKIRPQTSDIIDLDRGQAVARALGELDVGQAVAMQQGLVLATEGLDGTDALIRRAGAIVREGQRGPILIKLAKPQQDMRLDVPAFGPGTVASLVKAGFSGAYLDAGRTLIIDRDEVRALADAKGLFIEGVQM